MVAQVVKVQKCWRGLQVCFFLYYDALLRSTDVSVAQTQGRRRAGQVYKRKVFNAAHKIQGLYFRWHSRRLRLRAHLNFLNRGVVLLQSYFRMRSAIQFSNVIRLLLHNRKALRIQCQVRRMIGKKRCEERRQQVRFVHSQMVAYVKQSIQRARSSFAVSNEPDRSSASSVASQPESVGESEWDISEDRPMENLVVVYNKAMCSLVALARYDAVERFCGQMCLAMTALFKSSKQESATPNLLVDPTDLPRGLPLTMTYLTLSASWSRAGRMRQTRLDRMEEALGLMMQHSAVALISVQRVTIQTDKLPYIVESTEQAIESQVVPVENHPNRPHSVVSGDSTSEEDAYCGLPAWFLHLDENIVDLYYMCALRMQSVCSPYDTLLVLADWVWFQSSLLEHNLAANNMIDDYAAYVSTARSSLSGESPEAPSGPEQAVANYIPDAGSDSRPASAAGCGSRALNDQEAARQRAMAIRRVFRLLQRARKMLSPDSRDMREVTDRIDIFHDLHMTEHRSVLLDHKAFAFAFRGHFYSQQELIDRQRIASREAAGAKLARIQAAQSTQGKARGLLAQETTVKDATGNNAQNLGVDLQIILCGRTILVKGSVALHRLVETADDLPRNSTISAPSTRPTTAGSHGNPSAGTERPAAVSMDTSWEAFFDQEASGHPAPVMVAVRPLVLMRAEVKELVEQMNRDLGMDAILGSQVSAAEDTSLTTGRQDTSRSRLSTSDSVGSQSLQQSHRTAVTEVDRQETLKKKRRHVGGGHTVGEYARLTDYLKANLRVVSCQERFMDPILLGVVEEMRSHAHRNGHYADRYQFLSAEEKGTSAGSKSSIFPGVPSVRFSLPVVEYRRRVENEGQNVVHATFLLQRVFRGYQGRARYRRMRWKRVEFTEHQSHTSTVREAHDAVRRWRGERLTVIQRLFRGYRWRKRLHALKVSTLQIQCAFRIYRAKRIVSAERKRRTDGAPVVAMLGQGRGVTVGEFSFTLKIFRSGTNYRLEGLDMLRGAVYDGAVYTQEVMKLIKEHNAGIVGTSVTANSQRIMPWQHERVVELLIANLGIMTATHSVTSQLGGSGGQAKYILVADKHASPYTPPLHALATPYQLHGSVSDPVLSLATSHTFKQRMQRHAEHRQNSRYRRPSSKK